MQAILRCVVYLIKHTPLELLDSHEPCHDNFAGNGVGPAAIQDPFLQRLVRKDVITAKKVGQKAKDLMKDAPAVEQQLILRAESTKEHLARLFELQEGYQERLATFLRKAADSVGQAELTQQVSPPLHLQPCDAVQRERVPMRPEIRFCTTVM